MKIINFSEKLRRNISIILVGFILMTAASTAAAGSKITGLGTLTSIEDDGTVIIDQKGYVVSPTINVKDFRGRSISLTDIRPPHTVYFEYEYSNTGFMIVLLKEIAG